MHVVNNRGATALYLAHIRGHRDMITLLESSQSIVRSISHLTWQRRRLWELVLQSMRVR